MRLEPIRQSLTDDFWSKAWKEPAIWSHISSSRPFILFSSARFLWLSKQHSNVNEGKEGGICFEGLGQKESSLSFFAKAARDLSEKYLCMIFAMQIFGKKNKKDRHISLGMAS